MRFFVIIALWLTALSLGVVRSDDIDDEVTRLSRPNDGLWVNGAVRLVPLPENTPPEKIIEQVASFYGWGNPSHDYRIAQVKKVIIAPDTAPFTAVLVISAKGIKTVVLLRYEKAGWWNKGLDVP